jgi:hypothetical protein
MKPKYLAFNYKTVVITLLTVLASSILFVACKKDNSIVNPVNPDSTSQTVSSQTISSGEETISSRATNQAPRAKAGNDQTITLPANLNLDGSGSSDDDGSIASYQWTKEVGPSITIASPTSAQTAVTGLTGGSYRFRLTVTDNKGATGSDTVHITINGTGGTPTNQAPTVNAGTDKTITLPANSLSLTGTASDADGTVASYLWTKVSGSGGTIASANSATTNITGLTAGSYVFSLKATDNQGATATDNVTVTVNSGTTNQPPTVNAGTDKTITLPTNSVSLTGTASDPNGSVASYLWTKVSGFGGYISSPNSATTNITNLTAGSYVFSLQATDNQGATATDNVTVTVNSATNQPPTVNAGTDKTITLPVNSVSLAGTASDPNGTIASYLWTKVSGSGGTIASANSATTNITGLTAGSYVFSLKATDNQGATATDNVSVTVNAASGGTTGTLVYSNAYNSSSDISSSQLGRGGLSTSIYKTGPGSFRSEVRAGDAPISQGWRSEQQYGSNETPKEGIYEYDVYYENWGGFDGGGHSIQWHPYTSGASANISLQNYGGKFDVVRCIGTSVTHQSGTLKTCASNTWYHLRWEVRFSTGSDGYIRLFVDGVQTYSYNGANDDGSGQYLKLGQNRWPSGSGSSMTTTSVCYYDNLKIYKIN